MKIDLTGRHAVITGGSQGLGEGAAHALGEAGARVSLVARSMDRLEIARAALAAKGIEASAHPADITREDEVARIAAAIGPADILINCAGSNQRYDVTDFPLEAFEGVMAASLRGSFLMTRAFAGDMKRNRYGRIVNFASIMAHVSMPQRTAYSAAKASLLGFTKALAMELAPYAITCNSISPGPVATEINLPIRTDPAANKLFSESIPLGRWGDISEVAALTCFLCSDQAGFITGTDILIDGGWTAR